MKYKAVLFDFDGTVADTSPGIFESIKYALSKMNLPQLEDDELRLFVGPPLAAAFSQYCRLNQEEANKAVEFYRENYSAGALLNLNLYPGIMELLARLKSEGIKLAVCSSKPERFIKRILASKGLDELFDFAACQNDDDRKETKQELIERACKNLNICTNEAIMIGDRHFDIEGAVKAGCDSIGAVYGFGSEDELTIAGAAFTAKSVKDIEKILL